MTTHNAAIRLIRMDPLPINAAVFPEDCQQETAWARWLRHNRRSTKGSGGQGDSTRATIGICDRPGGIAMRRFTALFTLALVLLGLSARPLLAQSNAGNSDGAEARYDALLATPGSTPEPGDNIFA